MNKLTKLLSVFAIAGAIGTGIAGAAGCAHKHTYEEKWTSAGADGHYHVATCHPEEHDELKPHVYDDDNDKTCNDCGYERTITPTPSEKLEIAADVTGLIIEGVGDTTVNLSSDKKSHDIVKGNIKVYFAKGASLTKGDEVPAANLELTLKDPSGTDCTDWTGLKKNGAYTVYANLKDAKLASGSAFEEVSEITATATVTVNNAVVAGSLAVKSGATLEQVAGVDEIKSTWTYEVTRANGDKEDVAVANVTVSDFDTMTAGDSKTANLSCTIEGATVTGTVTYKIIENTNKVTQQFALNFSALTTEQENAIKAQAENTHNPLVLQDGRFAVCSTKSGEIATHGKSFDGKYFAKRLKMNGPSTGSKCPRYIKVHADGPAMLTVYAYSNTGTEGNPSDRLVAVYGGMTVTTEGNITATFTNQVGTSQATTEKTDTKHTFTLPAAGDYYIVSEVNGVCFTYVQLDQQVSAVGNEAITLGGEVVASSVSATHTSGKSAHVAKGTTFESIKSQYTVKVIGVNNVTCDSGETEVPLTDAKLSFVVPEDFETTIGEKTITVKYGDSITTTVKVYVESGVSGIYGMTSALNSTISTQVAAGTSLNIKKSDIVNTLLGASDNVNATITSYTVTYDSQEINDDTGTDFAISATPYTITVTAEVGDGQSTDTIITTFEITVSQRSTANKQQFFTPATVPTTGATIAAGGTIEENNLFKAVADGAMEYSAGDDATKSSLTAGVSATIKDGTSKKFNTGIRTAKATGADTTTVTITANEKITLTAYVIFTNANYNSDRISTIKWTQTGGTEQTETGTVKSGKMDRTKPVAITVTLNATQTLVIKGVADASTDGMLYLFGIEAEKVAE